MKRLLLIFALLSAISFGADARVGSSSTGVGSGATFSYTHTLAQSPTTDNCLVIGVATRSGGDPTLTSVTFSTGGSLTIIGPSADPTDNRVESYLAYGKIPSGATTSVTVAGTGSTNTVSIAQEYSGLDINCTADVTSSPAGSGFVGTNSWTSGSNATTQTDLLIGFCGQYYDSVGSFTAGTGWSSIADTTGVSSLDAFMEDHLSAASGSYAADGTYSAGTLGARYTYIFASFKLASGTVTKTRISGKVHVSGKVRIY